VTYLAAAYSIVWLLMLGYTVFLHRHQDKLEKRLAVLEETKIEK
jgi:CcmD family protein